MQSTDNLKMITQPNVQIVIIEVKFKRSYQPLYCTALTERTYSTVNVKFNCFFHGIQINNIRWSRRITQFFGQLVYFTSSNIRRYWNHLSKGRKIFLLDWSYQWTRSGFVGKNKDKIKWSLNFFNEPNIGSHVLFPGQN